MVDQTIQDVQLIIDRFNHQFEQWCDQIEDKLRKTIEIMSDQFIMLAIDWLSNRLPSNSKQSSINLHYQLNKLKHNYQQIVNQTQRIIKHKSKIQNIIGTKYFRNLEPIIQLRQSINCLTIYNSYDINQYKLMISEYQQQLQNYKITIDFCSYDTSLDHKIMMVQIINQMGIADKVAAIYIKINNLNSIDQQLIIMVLESFHNIYGVYINDQNSGIDIAVHQLIKQIVRQYTLIDFHLQFSSKYPQNTGHELQLVKEYNQIISHKYQLKQLWYYNSVFTEYARSEQEVQQLINRVRILQ